MNPPKEDVTESQIADAEGRLAQKRCVHRRMGFELEEEEEWIRVAKEMLSPDPAGSEAIISDELREMRRELSEARDVKEKLLYVLRVIFQIPASKALESDSWESIIDRVYTLRGRMMMRAGRDED